MSPAQAWGSPGLPCPEGCILSPHQGPGIPLGASIPPSTSPGAQGALDGDEVPSRHCDVTASSAEAGVTKQTRWGRAEGGALQEQMKSPGLLADKCLS